MGGQSSMRHSRWASMSRMIVLVIAVLLASAWSGSYVVTLGDYQLYQSGVWSAFMAPFGIGSLVRGVGYTDSLTLDPRLMPAKTVITWIFPSTPSASGIYGFPQQSYGSSNNGPHTTPSVQIKDLATLVSAHNVSITSNPNNYDVIYDAFLTSTPYGRNIEEFSVQVHCDPSAVAYIKSVKQLGTFVGSGVTWIVVQSTPGGQIIFVPSDFSDQLSITLDLKAMLNWLVTNGTLTGNEYFNGIALGPEPYVGGGSFTFNSWSVVQK